MRDLSSGATPARHARIERESVTALLGNAINFPGMRLQPAWGAVDLGDDFRRPARSEVPVVILVGDLDPRPPVENAREIAATLPNAQIVTLEIATHQFDLFGNMAIRTVLSRFLNGQPVGTDRLVLPAIVFQR
jgi:pimeloyl-ACP methyl ester carboxylesterase